MPTTNPTPIKTSSRTCFGIEWFATEAEATARSETVRARGDRVNGGFYDGMSCGRDVSFDFTDNNGVRHYAVTVR